MSGLSIFPGVDWHEGFLAAKLFVALHPEPVEVTEDFCPTKTAREKKKPAHIRIAYAMSEDGEYFIEVRPL